jgi:hypothetical protein
MQRYPRRDLQKSSPKHYGLGDDAVAAWSEALAGE